MSVIDEIVFCGIPEATYVLVVWAECDFGCCAYKY
jgi:hypothetical protein